ncbi:Uma2 family endonuclease [Streptomyces sp. NPDC059743]|uniref:Uma2 family endonuclease n=1 Tax=Streptomyces sp. NPDC059743 TaxID=3346928 RepID=UPI00365976F8
MTGTAERAVQISVEEFEKIARLVDKVSDTVRLEFIRGQIRFKGTADGDHREILGWLQQRCTQARTDVWLYAGRELGLLAGAYSKGRATPDADADADAASVLMAVEVTSYDTGFDASFDTGSDIDRRDREEKLAAYAAAGIPVHLLIDRGHGTVTVHSDPATDGYRDRHVVDFGMKVMLPDPVGMELDTEELKNFVR